MNDGNSDRARLMCWLAVILGVLSYTAVLAAYHITDGDLWGKLALGAHVWLRGGVPYQDLLAFTPVLPEYIDHEWGAGVIFFALIKWFGPGSLMALKLVLAFSALLTGAAVGRRLGCRWETLLLVAIPAAACLMPGYIPVVRCHAFTYFLFGLTLLCLEQIRAGKLWPAFVQPLVILFWANVHGGFVAGLGTIAVYTGYALLARRHFRTMLVVAIASGAVTLINPYGLKFWFYLLPAVLARRPRIEEWQPLPLFALDAFTAFRVLFALVVVVLLITWRRAEKRSWPGLVMLALTAMLGWRSRRHAPFFAVATLAFVTPFVETAAKLVWERLSAGLRAKLQPALVVVVLYAVVAFYAATGPLARASFQVLAPVGHDPVREVDILMHAKAEGNLATPFGWGSYISWRLFPKIKISMDGRYETTFPESTFQMSNDFYEKRGTNWDRLIREYPVDYVILEFQQERLRPEDLRDHGYELIWLTEGQSALMALKKHAGKLRRVVAELPPSTIEPLDARIAEAWWPR